MKNLKFNGFFGILFSLFFIEACKEIDVDLNPDLRTVIAICEILASDNDSKVRIYSVELDEGSVNVRESMVAAGEGSTFKMDGEGVDFSFSVNEWGLGTPYVSTTKSYTGKLYEAAFVKDQVNRLDVVRDGSEWKLLVNGSDQNIPGSAEGGYNCIDGSCVSVTSGAQYSTMSDCISDCSSGGSEVLVDTTITGSSQDRQYYHFTVPEGVTFMDIRTKETPPDATYNHADLFVRKGYNPTTEDDPYDGYSADCASLSNNREQDFCEFDNPSGTYYVMLYNYNGSFYASNLVVTITR